MLPNDPSTIWVGTDIGLFESNDDGASWHYADNGIPAVSVYDMFVQDKQVVVATHGRGIWTANIDEMNYIPEITSTYIGQQKIEVEYSIDANVDSLEIYLNNDISSVVKNVTTGQYSEEISISDEGSYELYVVSYKSGTDYRSSTRNTVADFKPIISQAIKDPDSDNTIKITAEINENYDSVHVMIDNEYHSTVTETTIGTNTLSATITSTKSYNVSIKGYIENVGYQSESKSVYMTFVGIANINEVESLKIYPNPTTGQINIEIPEEINGNVTVDIYSLTGAKLNSQKVNKDNGRLDISNLNNGIYLLRMEHNGKIYSQKVKLNK